MVECGFIIFNVHYSEGTLTLRHTTHIKIKWAVSKPSHVIYVHNGFYTSYAIVAAFMGNTRNTFPIPKKRDREKEIDKRKCMQCNKDEASFLIEDFMHIGDLFKERRESNDVK
jgi:hypothetical protein